MNVQHVLSCGCTNVIDLYSYHVYRISFGTLIDERDPRRYPEDCKSRIPYTRPSGWSRAVLASAPYCRRCTQIYTLQPVFGTIFVGYHRSSSSLS